MKKLPTPTKHNVSVLHQLCKLIPAGLVGKLAAKYGVAAKCRTFSAWSHVVSLLYCQLTHAISLNDVCDGLRHHAAKLKAVRGATPPSRNGFSHANKNRNSQMMEALFWETLTTLQNRFKKFGPAGRYPKLPRRFKRAIHAIDSTTITLVANCMDWAKHRRRKAAAKMHLRLNLQTFLPGFAIIEKAAIHDSRRMGALCAALQPGEIAIFDKAYLHFEHLFELTSGGVNWVMRAKENMTCHVCRKRQRGKKGKILEDDEITLKVPASRKQYPKRLRRIKAEVEEDGEIVVMVFLTNNLEWAASSICDLYASRWAIETFFKQIKQTLQICDFLGYSKQAIEWQLWAALLLYVLLRFQQWISQWTHSFTRLNALIAGILWDRFDLIELLQHYGTAGSKWRMRSQPEALYLPGFAP